MEIEATFTMDPGQVLSAYRSFRRTWYRGVAGLGLLLAFLGLLYSLLASNKAGAAGMWATAYGLFLACLPELALRWSLWRQRHLMGHEVHMFIREASIQSQSALGKAELAWTTFRKAYRRSGFWMLAVSSYQALFVPESALSAESGDRLEALLRGKGLLKN